MATDDLIREAHDPSTTPARLHEIAQADRATWTAIAANPAAYDGLLTWLGEHGDDDLRGVIAARGGAPAPAAVETPTVVIPAEASERVSYGSVPPGGPAVVPNSAPSGGRKNGLILAGMVAVVVALVGGAIVGVSALGSDDDDDTTATSASPDPASPTSDVPTSAPTSDAPDTAGSGSIKAFCAAMKEAQSVGMSSAPEQGATPAPDDLSGFTSSVTEAYATVAKVAPADIRDEATVMSSYMALMSDLTATDPSKLSAGIADFSDAARKVTTYYAKNCF